MPKSITKSVPAPVGGVNARDALAAMPPTDAIVMDNWFPNPSYVAVRNGCQSWATSLPAAVETVMAYNGTSLRKLFCASGTAFYDGTSNGAATITSVTGLANARWQHQMFNAGGGNVLIAVNGADAPRVYDGNAIQGGVKTTGTLTPGTGYATPGTYTNVSLTGGTGSGAKATIIVAGGVVTSVTITTAGSAYLVGDSLSASNTNLGGSGSGFAIAVQTITGWSVTTISGTNTLTGGSLAPANLITVTVFKQRVWYVENNSMNVWYSGIQAFQGVLSLIPLGQIFKMGGYLMQMATWTVDNVSGMDDYAAFITSEGEVAIYQGYDPTQISTWSLIGVFRIGRPIGRRCYTKVGSDIYVICADGLTPLSQAMLTDRTQTSGNLTYKILNAINLDVQNYNANFGWQVIEYPLGNKLLINVPEATNTSMHQWVMNSVTKAWCRFKSWNANCWELQQDSLYFGGLNTIYLADTGTNDAGIPITVDCKPAFSYFDLPGQVKRFVMARPIFQTSAAIQPNVILNVDFGDVAIPAPSFSAGGTAPWNTSPWNTTPWGGTSPSLMVKNWLGVAGIGYVACGRLAMQLKGIAVQWFSTDYMLEPGGPL